MMNWHVFSLLSGLKLIDVLGTFWHIQIVKTGYESNPVMLWLMQALGVVPLLALNFAISVALFWYISGRLHERVYMILAGVVTVVYTFIAFLIFIAEKNI